MSPTRLTLPALALALAAGLPSAAEAQQAPKLTDANIVAIFDAANTADIQTGTLAASRASDSRVRDLGKHFAGDHEMVRQQGRDLAKKLGVTPVAPSGDRSQADLAATLRTLKDKKGKDFDRAFLDYEIAFHQSVIDAVTTTLLPAIQNDELRGFVQRIAPAFVGHLEQAKAVRKAVFGE